MLMHLFVAGMPIWQGKRHIKIREREGGDFSLPYAASVQEGNRLHRVFKLWALAYFLAQRATRSS